MLPATAVLGGLLVVLALLWWRTAFSRVGLFWAAFILIRGGLGLGRDIATLALIALIALALWIIPQRAGKTH